MRFIRCIYMARHNTAVPSHLLLLALNKDLWTLLGNGFFVFKDEQWGVAGEEAVDVL
jgi:hypothetical protein